MTGVLEKLKKAYEKADQGVGGYLELVRQGMVRFGEMRGSEAAASLAYYALFSFFPLVLFLISVLSFILSNSEEAYYQTLLFMRTALPVSRRLIEDNLSQIFQHRGSIGLIGLLWLLWAGSGFFTILARNVNLAWPSLRLRSMMQSRLVAVAMVGGLFGLLLLALISTSVVEALPALLRLLEVDQSILLNPVWQMLLRLVPGFFSFMLFLALYLWVPNKTVHWGAAWRGALVGAMAWELAKNIFSRFVGSGLYNYEILYGSLGTLIAFLLWIYISSVIVLLCAHLVAGLDMRADQQAEARQKGPASQQLEQLKKGT
jgi:membrane protein